MIPQFTRVDIFVMLYVDENRYHNKLVKRAIYLLPWWIKYAEMQILEFKNHTKKAFKKAFVVFSRKIIYLKWIMRLVPRHTEFTMSWMEKYCIRFTWQTAMFTYLYYLSWVELLNISNKHMLRQLQFVFILVELI